MTANGKTIHRYFIPLVFILISSIALAADRDADHVPVAIKEWQVPYADTRPRDPFVAPDGRVWFCGQTGAYIAVLDPNTGEFKKYDMPDNERPHNLIIDDTGSIWFAGNTQGYIGKLNPQTGDIERFAMPEGVNDPHTLVFDNNGDIWFTAQHSNIVGHFSVDTAKTRFVKMNTDRARPYGIWMDSGDRPWVVLFGTNKLATVDPETFKLEEISLPHSESLPRRLAITSDDQIWYVDYKRGSLGRFDPVTRSIKQWPMPAGTDARPYGMAVDDKDRLWFVETGIEPNRMVGFDSKAEKFISKTPIPSGGGTIRHMMFDPKQRAVWFGADTNTVGRILVP